MNYPKVQGPNDEGVPFRLDPNLTAQVNRVIEPMMVPNGIGWNEADDPMYQTDSMAGRIDAFDFDAHAGVIRNQRVHFEVTSPACRMALQLLLK